jgi:hypothetical protein
MTASHNDCYFTKNRLLLSHNYASKMKKAKGRTKARAHLAWLNIEESYENYKQSNSYELMPVVNTRWPARHLQA